MLLQVAILCVCTTKVRSSTVEFLNVGRTFQQQDYATIVNNINLKPLYEIFGKIHDEYVSVYESTDNPKVYAKNWEDIKEKSDINKVTFIKIKDLHSQLNILLKLLYKEKVSTKLALIVDFY